MRGVDRLALGVVLASGLLGVAVCDADSPGRSGALDPEDEYTFRLAGCTACHTTEDGPHLGGGRALDTPFGTFYSPNISSSEQGIGKWSEKDLGAALRDGVAPDGADYYPVFPYTSYTAMHDADVAAIYRYLRSTEPVANPNRAHDVPWYLGFRILNWFWKLLFFDRGRFEADPGRGDAWNRGAYVAQALAHCGECHAPRNLFGAVRSNAGFSGNPDGPEGEAVPNITPHQEDGIGLWSPAEVVDYLTSGALPDGDYAGGAMYEVIEEGLQHLRKEDAGALATYLLSAPAR